MDISLDFYKGKKVFITGHTGFKGSWLCQILKLLGADVVGYALLPQMELSMYNSIGKGKDICSVIGDIRDFDTLFRAFHVSKPEIVMHLAAQPIVRESYRDPVYTYETNIMGTVNILECVRKTDTVRSFINITTDKVYKNKEWCYGYRENDELDGHEPYSNSKSCSELITASYRRSFFEERKIAVSTARAGNVIGGGDFSQDRIIPDCVRAAVNKKNIIVRNPNSVRPYQFVLEPLFAYLIIAAKQYEDIKYADNYNIGPNESDAVKTGKLADIFCEKWGAVKWEKVEENNAPHEDNYLKLDCSKIRSVFGWKSIYDIENAIEKTVEWYKYYYSNSNMLQFTENQITDYYRCLASAQ